MTERLGPIPVEPTTDVVTALAAVAAALSAAGDEKTALATTMSYVQQFGPQGARLIYLYPDMQGTQHEFEVVAEWRDRQICVDGIAPLLSYPLADDPLIKLCVGGGS